MAKHAPNFIDLTGQKFGDWEVRGFSHRSQTRLAYWHCVCSCGKECESTAWPFYLLPELCQ